MPWFELIWEWDDEEGNIAHIAEHGNKSRGCGRGLREPRWAEKKLIFRTPYHVWLHERWTSDRRVVYEQLDETTLYPITAYEVE